MKEKIWMKVSKTVIVMLLFAGISAGIVSGTPDVKINITGIPVVGQNANAVLKADYTNFAFNDIYLIVIHNKTNQVVYNQVGRLSGMPKETIQVNWTPKENGTHLVTASGVGITFEDLIIVSDSAVISPIPELPTLVLMSAGLLGLFGLVRWRRMN